MACSGALSAPETVKSPRASAQGEFHGAEEEPAEGSEGRPLRGAALPQAVLAVLAVLAFHLHKALLGARSWGQLLVLSKGLALCTLAAAQSRPTGEQERGSKRAPSPDPFSSGDPDQGSSGTQQTSG